MGFPSPGTGSGPRRSLEGNLEKGPLMAILSFEFSSSLVIKSNNSLLKRWSPTVSQVCHYILRALYAWQTAFNRDARSHDNPEPVVQRQR